MPAAVHPKRPHPLFSAQKQNQTDPPASADSPARPTNPPNQVTLPAAPAPGYDTNRNFGERRTQE